MSRRETILDVPIDCVTLDEAVDRAIERMNAGKKGYIVTPNAEILHRCTKDPGLRAIVQKAALSLPDGVGVLYAAKILKKSVPCKVAGIDFGWKLLERMAGDGKSVFFLGGKPGVAEKAARRCEEACPGLVVKGVRDGYFENPKDAVSAIGEAGSVDCVFVCLGAPKQERFMAEHIDRIDATLLCGLGGSLDVFAGEVSRAPERWIRLRIEWLYRLLKNPRRLGRMIKIPVFLASVCIDRWKGGEG